MSNKIQTNYSLEVVQAGDEASGNFKENCDEANERLGIRKFLETDGRIWSVKTGDNGVESVIESIDGVGTKIQIYTNRFNYLVSEKEKSNLTDTELLNLSIELWERMLHDLIAMNVDDLRNGEMAVAVTNIIDINHLKGIRGKVFSDSMGQALCNVIIDLDIAMTAGETAVLGESNKVQVYEKLLNDVWGGLTDILNLDTSNEVKSKIKNILKSINNRMSITPKDLEFNIGGTGLGIIGDIDKLIDLEEGQAVVYIGEKPTENGIIGPRSNGITAIRNHMKNIAGEGWENISFEEFLEIVGEIESSKLSDELKQECSGLDMWDIATGKTTVFNPLVSRNILGGIDGNPIADVSSIVHVTGNPIRKISEGLRGRDDLSIDLYLNSLKIPQIIEILQILGNITDEEALGSWNMGIPYLIICNKKEAFKVVREARKEGFAAGTIGNVVDKKTNPGKISGVGIGNSSVEID